jgi:hypothetical protein
MLTEAQIRTAIVNRLDALSGSCNRTHIDHNDGVIRGLLWALTGKDPGCYLTANTLALCQLAGIPAERRGDTVYFER